MLAHELTVMSLNAKGKQLVSIPLVDITIAWHLCSMNVAYQLSLKWIVVVASCIRLIYTMHLVHQPAKEASLSIKSAWLKD